MRNIEVKVHPSSANLKKQDQLAWQIAEIATDKSKVSGDFLFKKKEKKDTPETDDRPEVVNKEAIA